MASPQLENGHLKIANEVFDALIHFEFNAAEYCVIMAVIRMSWGWHKKECQVSISDLCRLTERPRTSITDALKTLKDSNVLCQVTAGGGRGNPSVLKFNKDWESWKVSVRSFGQNKLSEINCPKINSMESRTVYVRNSGQFITEYRTVSPDNLFETKEQQPPKDIFKDKRHIGAKNAPRAKDEAYEIWCSEFLEHRKIPYRSKKADWVQLDGLRKQLGLVNGKSTPDGWNTAVHNYLLSPLASYTLAGMCSRFDVFLSSALDRFNKPVTSTTGQNKQKSFSLDFLPEEETSK